MESAVEEINALARSCHRPLVLKWVLEEGPLTIDEIRNRADASRTTVNRNLDALEAHGWVNRRNREYTITPTGELVAEKFYELVTIVQTTTQLRPIAEWVPAAALDIDVEALATATVVTSRPTDPYAPVARHIDAMASADEFRCLLPAVGLPAMRTAAERVIEDGCSQEIIVPEGVIRTLTETPTYRNLLIEMLETGRVTIFVSEKPCRYYLGLTETVIQIGVQDFDGVPRGLIELDASAARPWAERTYADYKDRSQRFHLSADSDAEDSPPIEHISPYLD